MAKAKEKFSEIVNEAGYKGERILVEKREKPLAVIISYDDYKKLEELEDMVESRVLEKALKKGKFYSLEEASRKLKIEL